MGGEAISGESINPLAIGTSALGGYVGGSLFGAGGIAGEATDGAGTLAAYNAGEAVDGASAYAADQTAADQMEALTNGQGFINGETGQIMGGAVGAEGAGGAAGQMVANTPYDATNLAGEYAKTNINDPNAFWRNGAIGVNPAGESQAAFQPGNFSDQYTAYQSGLQGSMAGNTGTLQPTNYGLPMNQNIVYQNLQAGTPADSQMFLQQGMDAGTDANVAQLNNSQSSIGKLSNMLGSGNNDPGVTTESYNAYVRAGASPERMDALAKSVAAGIVQTGPDGTIVSNPAGYGVNAGKFAVGQMGGPNALISQAIGTPQQPPNPYSQNQGYSDESLAMQRQQAAARQQNAARQGQNGGVYNPYNRSQYGFA